jgi:hypothetical protein
MILIHSFWQPTVQYHVNISEHFAVLLLHYFPKYNAHFYLTFIILWGRIALWYHYVHPSNFWTKWRIFIKLGMNIIPLEDTLPLYFLHSLLSVMPPWLPRIISGHMKSILSFQFDGDTWMNHKDTQQFCMKHFLWINSYKLAIVQKFEVISDKFNTVEICTCGNMNRNVTLNWT